MDLKRISIYREQFRSIKRLTDEQAGVVLKAIVQFAEEGEFPHGLDVSCDILLDAITEKISRDAAEYTAKCERNRKNIKNRW